MWRARNLELQRNNELFIMAAGFLFLNQKKKKRFWVRPSLKNRQKNYVEELLEDLRKDDRGISGEMRCSFKNFLRMTSTDLENLIEIIGPSIQKKNTNFRNAISVTERLVITLRFLATGEYYQSLMYLFKVSKQAISVIIPETCDALISALNTYVKTPQSEEEWEKVSDDFNKIWHFPHCIGAMDGKHIVIEAPTFSGSEFLNYKGTFSVVLFAVVDANYNFLYANVGCQGRISDGGVFKNTPFYKLLVEGKLNLPQKRVLLGRDKESPYVLVADDAFPLKPCIMKPYSGHQDKGSIERVFNYRISRARRIVENVFGILASVFRVFRKPMLLQPEKVEKVTLACICLHNYLRCVLSKNKYNPPNSFDVEHIDSGTLEDGAWRKDQQTLQSFFNLQQTARKSSVEAMEIRKEFAEYFMSEQGQVPWQLKFC